MILQTVNIFNFRESELNSNADDYEAFYSSFVALASDYISSCANTCKS